MTLLLHPAGASPRRILTRCQKPRSSLLTTKPLDPLVAERTAQVRRLHVLEADTGRAALEKITEGVDLVLLDYRLPDIDGVTLLRRMKEFDPDILVVLLTAYAKRRDRSRGDEARRVSFRQQAVQPRRGGGDGRARARDDKAAARGAAVPLECGASVQPAADRRRPRHDPCASDSWSRALPPVRPRRCS